MKDQKYNRAKSVYNLLICGANNSVEHYGRVFKSGTGVLLMAELTGHGHHTRFGRKGLDDHALLGQASKGHSCRILILFP